MITKCLTLVLLVLTLSLNIFAQTSRIEYANPDGSLGYVDVPIVTSILPAVALTGVKDTLLYSGAGAIDFVIMGDGFMSSEQDSFVYYAQKFVNKFLITPPWSLHPTAYNFYVLKINASQSGIKHLNTASDCNWANPLVPISTVVSPFNLSFDYSGTHRLVYVNTTSIIGETMLAAFPNADYGLVIANSIYYGGAGGTYPVATKHTQSSDIMLHELGHTFAALGDEYGGGVWCGPERANITNILVPLKWDSLVNTYFLGANYCNTWYRPQIHCMMENLSYPYCIVCSKMIDNKINLLVPPPVILPLAVNGVVSNVNCPLSGSIDQTTTGGVTPYTYVWSNGATTEDVLSIAYGNFSCTITSANNQTVVKTYTILNNVLSVPINVLITPISNTKLVVSCATVLYANKYQVYYKKASVTTWSGKQSNTPSVTLSNLTPNTTYNIKIRARCLTGTTYKNSLFSATYNTQTSALQGAKIEYIFNDENKQRKTSRVIQRFSTK